MGVPPTADLLAEGGSGADSPVAKQGLAPGGELAADSPQIGNEPRARHRRHRERRAAPKQDVDDPDVQA